MLISPTEPFIFRPLGKVSSLPERYGCDFLIVHNKVRTGVQRKKFPADFLSSIADGRLYEQVQKMESLDRRVLIVEGLGKWTQEGELVDMRAFKKSQLFGFYWSFAFEFGFEVIQVRGMEETVEALKSLEAWSRKAKHVALKTRPGGREVRDSWGRVSREKIWDRMLQSFPGVGHTMAQRIIQHFGRLPMRWDLEGVEELMKVEGVGKVKAKQMWEALEK